MHSWPLKPIPMEANVTLNSEHWWTALHLSPLFKPFPLSQQALKSQVPSRTVGVDLYCSLRPPIIWPISVWGILRCSEDDLIRELAQMGCSVRCAHLLELRAGHARWGPRGSRAVSARCPGHDGRLCSCHVALPWLSRPQGPLWAAHCPWRIPFLFKLIRVWLLQWRILTDNPGKWSACCYF